jgi:hypothetical protein
MSQRTFQPTFFWSNKAVSGVEEQSVNFWGPVSNDHNILGTNVSPGRKVQTGLTLVLHWGGRNAKALQPPLVKLLIEAGLALYKSCDTVL